jgi:2-dehydropantoate 2-reductase
VATRQGIKLPYADPVVAVEEVARNTASNISSMLQDVLRGTPTEIDAINGAIIKAGEQVKVPTPVNTMLWQLVKSLDQH